MYVGAISGVIGSFMYEQNVAAAQMNAFLAIGIPLACCLLAVCSWGFSTAS